jgi:antitoxin component of RelBE/YafQ-DinJ toxin-antitoxin module
MTKSIQIRTPRGIFASASQAAKAMNCDKSTVLNRCRTDPENYQRIPVDTENPRTMPVAQGWNHYRFLPNDQREQLFQAWCHQHALDPEQDGVADRFIASLDTDTDLADTEESLDEQS